MIGKESSDCRRVGIDLAHDLSMYNQEACFSPQIVFVEGDHRPLMTHLEAGLRLYEDLLPKEEASLDVHAHVSRSRLEALYEGNEVLTSEGGTGWTIIAIDALEQINEHPLSRTAYVMSVAEISDCLRYVDAQTQTVTISPWERQIEIREQLTLRGATKITAVGLVETSRIGSTHDGMFPMHRLVRWVCVERGSDYWGKYVREGPIDTTKWLMMHEQQLERLDT